MFDRRLQSVLFVLGVLLVVIIARLGQMQIVQADFYRRQAEQAVVSRPVALPFVRGSILDRTGEMLVCEEPRWDVTLDFDVIAAVIEETPDRWIRVARRWKRVLAPDTDDATALEYAMRRELGAMWGDLALFCADFEPLSKDELRERARDTHDRVMRIRRTVAERRGFDAPVAEESVAHPVVSGLDAERQVAARDAFSRYPWLHVEASTVRTVLGNATPLAHVIGRMGRVDAEDVSRDPNADDPFARYTGEERLGISGVEAAAESRLRGRRGQVVRDVDGNIIEADTVIPEDGENVRLTIHAELQRRLYSLLEESVSGIPESSGGAIVVVSVPAREVLALVSYPAYDPTRFDELYPRLRDDTERLPLAFRAVASRYAPGSIIKPLACLAGLMSGRITVDSREECRGYLFPEVRDRWRCWQVHGTDQRKEHGFVTLTEALTGSCNVFMYRLGEKLGVDRLCSSFDMAGIGRLSGSGLREELKGINPTSSWLMSNKNIRPTAGTARLFAIGQGELAVTPIQVANLMATYANGRYRPVTLIRSSPYAPEWVIPATGEQWQAVRRGIYGVVNDSDGTAHKYAFVEHPRYVLCGKTGSASAAARPTAYRIPFTAADGRAGEAVVRGGALPPALERFAEEFPGATADVARAEVADWWPRGSPPEGDEFAHAWFAGFLQEKGTTGHPDWSRTPKVAFAVLVEYGGSGGRASGPVAQRVVAELLRVFGDELDVDTGSAVGMN